MEAANELRRVGEGAPPSLQAGVCARLGHPRGLAPRGARVDGVGTELLLDAHELVVLCVAVGAAGRARLDLAGAQSDGQVGNGGVLGLARAMGAHDTPARLLAHLDRVDRLGDGPDLVHLEQQRVGRLLLDGPLDLDRVGHSQVVAHNLDRLAVLGHECRPVLPVVLVERVLDGDDREVAHQLAVKLGELCGRQHGLLALDGVPHAQVVHGALSVGGVLDLELGGGHVQSNRALAVVASLLDGLHHQLQARPAVAGGREAALVTDEGGVAAKLLLDDALERVVYLGADHHGLTEVLCARRDDEIFLEGQLVPRVRPAVNHVEARHRHHELGVSRQVGEVAVEWHALRSRASLGGGQGDAEHRVGAELALVLGPVNLQHEHINGRLVGRVHANKLGRDQRVDVVHGRLDALPHVPRVRVVAQLHRLIRARGRARRDRRA
mmetsp:Transcript_16772/g.54601  ORF Transcript_16772/g.54601 Transcript_16772/m.54601 type:complete len:438 (-) Transcript_16772:248-1561(-)